jgi:hypothetical protein
MAQKYLIDRLAETPRSTDARQADKQTCHNGENKQVPMRANFIN